VYVGDEIGVFFDYHFTDSQNGTKSNVITQLNKSTSMVGIPDIKSGTYNWKSIILKCEARPIDRGK
jgi:hypothetical protein